MQYKTCFSIIRNVYRTCTKWACACHAVKREVACVHNWTRDGTKIEDFSKWLFSISQAEQASVCLIAQYVPETIIINLSALYTWFAFYVSENKQVNGERERTVISFTRLVPESMRRDTTWRRNQWYSRYSNRKLDACKSYLRVQHATTQRRTQNFKKTKKLGDLLWHLKREDRSHLQFFGKLPKMHGSNHTYMMHACATHGACIVWFSQQATNHISGVYLGIFQFTWTKNPISEKKISMCRFQR